MVKKLPIRLPLKPVDFLQGPEPESEREACHLFNLQLFPAEKTWIAQVRSAAIDVPENVGRGHIRISRPFKPRRWGWRQRHGMFQWKGSGQPFIYQQNRHPRLRPQREGKY